MLKKIDLLKVTQSKDFTKRNIKTRIFQLAELSDIVPLKEICIFQNLIT